MNVAQVVPDLEIRTRLAKIVNALEIFHRRVQGNCLILSGDATHFVTKMQAEQSLNWHNETDQLLYGTIIDHCVRAERAGPGSFFSTLSILIDALKQQKLEITKADYESIIKASFVPTWDQLESFVRETINDDFLGTLVMQVLETTGLEGKIFFEESENSSVSIELINGFNFVVTFPFAVNDYKQKDVMCVVVDGFVESVSEVHHLLQKFSETKEQLVFIARGFSNDVINTMKVNYDRKTLNIFPITVKFDFDGINMLGDIATVCGTDPVSSTKGQLISTIKYEDIVRVPQISCTGTSMTVVNDKTVQRAQVQVQKLAEKRREAPIEDLARLFDVRIKALTPNCTKVRIPDGRQFSEYSEKFDVAIRLVKSAIKRGMISKDRISSNSNVFSDFPKMMTVESALATLQYSKSCFWMLHGTKTLIV